jgi:transposase
MLPNKPRGVPRVNDRRVLNGIFWVLRSGKLLSRPKPGSMLLADRGYDADWMRELAREKGGVGQHPPEKQSQRSDLLQPVPLSRSQPGRTFFNRIKQCRRVATRYDRLAGNYLAFVQLASIRLWLAARYECTP